MYNLLPSGCLAMIPICIPGGANCCDEFPQSAARMIPACGNLYELIVNQVIAHDGDPMFADQVLSAAQRSTESGWRLSKGKSKRKIDAAIALSMAVDRATRREEVAPVPGFFVV